MSGGHFDYVHSRASAFAEDLQRDIANNAVPNSQGQAHNFSEPVIDALTLIQVQAEKLSRMMKAAEDLYEFDIDEDSFLKEMLEIEKTL
jgi:DNA-binding transcriptional regulator GbsR (MarR family)